MFRRTLVVIMVAFLVIGTVSLSTYSNSFDNLAAPKSLAYSAKYALGNLVKGFVVEIIIDIPNYMPGYAADTIIVPTFLNAAGATAAFACATDSAMSLSLKEIKNCVVPANGLYFLVLTISPYPSDSKNYIQHYKLLVNYFNSALSQSAGSSNTQTLVKATEVVRDKYTRLVYISTSQNMKITFYPVKASAGSTSSDVQAARAALAISQAALATANSNLATANAAALIAAAQLTTATSNQASLATLQASAAAEDVAKGQTLTIKQGITAAAKIETERTDRIDAYNAALANQQTAQTEYNTAHAALLTVNANLAAANQAVTDANTAASNANQAVTTATNALGPLQTQVDTATAALTAAQGALTTSQAALTTANGNLATANAAALIAAAQLTTATSNQASLATLQASAAAEDVAKGQTLTIKQGITAAAKIETERTDRIDAYNAALANQQTAQTEYNTAHAALLTANANLAAANQAVTDANTAASNANQAVITATDALGPLQTQVDTATAALTAAQGALTTSQAALTTANGNLATANAAALIAAAQLTTATSNQASLATLQASAAAEDAKLLQDLIKEQEKTAAAKIQAERGGPGQNGRIHLIYAYNAALAKEQKAQTAYNTAHAALLTANANLAAANQAVTDANTAVSNANQAVTTATNALGPLQTQVDTATAALTAAQGALTTSQAALTTANGNLATANAAALIAAAQLTTATSNQASLATLQASAAAEDVAKGQTLTIKQGITAAAKIETERTDRIDAYNAALVNQQTAQTEYNTAHAALLTANANLAAANQAVTDANTAASNANQAVTTATNALGPLQTQVDTATAALTAAQGALTTSQAALTTANGNLATANAAALIAAAQLTTVTSNQASLATLQASAAAEDVAKGQTLTIKQGITAAAKIETERTDRIDAYNAALANQQTAQTEYNTAHAALLTVNANLAAANQAVTDANTAASNANQAVITATDALGPLQTQVDTATAALAAAIAASVSQGGPLHPDDTDSVVQFKKITKTGSNNFYDAQLGTSIIDYTSQSPTWTSVYDHVTKIWTLQSKRTISPGFYLLAYSLTTSQNPINRVTYQSDQYTCPYISSFPDLYKNFEPCRILGDSDNGFPCTSYNQILSKCTACLPGYELINNFCRANTSCPDRQYYSYGDCFLVDQNCGEYNIFTGDCFDCRDPANYNLIGFACVRKFVVCRARQWQRDYKCFDVSPTCNTFDASNGSCLTCVPNHDLLNGQCKEKVVICTNRQYLENYVCYNIPTECLTGRYDSVLKKCQVCIQGYNAENGICKKIICPARQVPANFGIFCKEVSSLCEKYDQVSGDCQSCKEKNHVVRDGRCIQSNSPLAGCQGRENLGFGKCQNAQGNCKSFNLLEKLCIQCDSGYYLDFTGQCTKTGNCAQGEIFVNGFCLKMPDSCLAVDNIGLCRKCVDESYRLQYGQCVYHKKCAENEYLSSEGECIQARSGCSFFNPSNGQCITCSNGQSPVNGLCCSIGQVNVNDRCLNAADQQFKKIFQPKSSACLQFHPYLSLCVQCDRGFEVEPLIRLTCIPER